LLYSNDVSESGYFIMTLKASTGNHHFLISFHYTFFVTANVFNKHTVTEVKTKQNK